MPYPTYTYTEVVMKHSPLGKASPLELAFTPDERNELMLAVKYANNPSVTGYEALSYGDKFDLFFKEIGTAIDKRMAAMAKSIHLVDFQSVQKKLEKDEVLYVRNTSTEVLTPEGYLPGMGNMMAHTKNVTDAVYIICSLKTEASRLYDWLKQIITKGRMDTEFKWTISEFGQAVTKAEDFVKNLPDRSRNLRYNLGQVYISFDEVWAVMNIFNNSVRTLGGRDVEITAKVLNDVYGLGQLLVKKIHANDIKLTPEAVNDIEMIVNKFAGLCNISGAMMVLLNELSAVFNSQLKTLSELKY